MTVYFHPVHPQRSSYFRAALHQPDYPERSERECRGYNRGTPFIHTDSLYGIGHIPIKVS